MPVDIPDELPDWEELYKRECQWMIDLEKLPQQEIMVVKTVILENENIRKHWRTSILVNYGKGRGYGVNL